MRRASDWRAAAYGEAESLEIIERERWAAAAGEAAFEREPNPATASS